MSDNLARDTFRGMRWIYGATLVSATIQVGYAALMGRLLSPAAFGLLAMGQVMLNFGNHIAQLGVGSALVQKLELTDRDIRTGFTSALLLGGLAATAVAGAAPLAARAFSNADLVGVIRGLSFTFVGYGVALVPMGLLRRALRFRALAVIQVCSSTVGYMGVGLTLALLGFGVSSLVAAAVTQSLVQAVLAYGLTRHPVRLLVAWPELRALYSFGGRVTVIGLFESIGETLDVFFIGRFSGQAALGQYNRASLLIALPLGQLMSGLQQVLLPAFSRIQEDLARVRRAYVTTLRLSAALLLPLAAGMATAAPELVRVVLGNQWDAAAAVLPILAAVMVLHMLTHYSGVVCEALAILDLKLALQVAYVVVLVGALLATRGAPLPVIALGVLAAELLRHLLYLLLISRSIGVTARDYAVIYAPALGTALAVAMLVGGASALLRTTGTADFVVLIGQVLAGAVVLAVATFWGPLSPVRHELRARLHNAGSTAAGGRIAVLADRLLLVGRPPRLPRP